MDQKEGDDSTHFIGLHQQRGLLALDRKVLIQEVERRRVELEMPEQQSFLVIDNCSSHTDDDVRGIFAQHNIVPVLIPPHGSHIFQPLDGSASA